ncbi:hypothetical protein X798_00763 [Onchocerca flexuosa]|uniref:Uncharacterized protein n=1 Tax=Onchocerca flexuosa TaxID=387005 RepID=A0A238C448_9BILA|nr:hypothetical protein X798_00763 [Onchocerca flexuosa]
MTKGSDSKNCAVQRKCHVYGSIWASWSAWSFCVNKVRVRVRACNTVRGFSCLGKKQEFMECDSDHTVQPAAHDSDYTAVDPWEEDRREAMKQLYSQMYLPDKSEKVDSMEGKIKFVPRESEILRRERKKQASTSNARNSNAVIEELVTSSPFTEIITPSVSELESNDQQQQQQTSAIADQVSIFELESNDQQQQQQTSTIANQVSVSELESNDQQQQQKTSTIANQLSIFELESNDQQQQQTSTIVNQVSLSELESNDQKQEQQTFTVTNQAPVSSMKQPPVAIESPHVQEIHHQAPRASRLLPIRNSPNLPQEIDHSLIFAQNSRSKLKEIERPMLFTPELREQIAIDEPDQIISSIGEEVSPSKVLVWMPPDTATWMPEETANNNDKFPETTTTTTLSSSGNLVTLPIFPLLNHFASETFVPQTNELLHLFSSTSLPPPSSQPAVMNLMKIPSDPQIMAPILVSNELIPMNTAGEPNREFPDRNLQLILPESQTSNRGEDRQALPTPSLPSKYNVEDNSNSEFMPSQKESNLLASAPQTFAIDEPEVNLQDGEIGFHEQILISATAEKALDLILKAMLADDGGIDQSIMKSLF